MFWFRDYWANRQEKLNFRNSFSYIPETGTFRKFSSKLRRVNELMLNTDSNRCMLSSSDGSSKYEVMNPMKLKEKFEPWVIEMEEGSTDELRPLSPISQLRAKELKKFVRQIIGGCIALIVLIVFMIAINEYYFIMIFAGLVILAYAYFLPSYFPKETRTIIYFYNGSDNINKHYKISKDVPSWLGKKDYFVFRYVILYPFEYTLNIKTIIQNPSQLFIKKEDWERIDAWVDAKTGELEWIVSDYHWRELWYDADSDAKQIFIIIHPNFHIPEPVLRAGDMGKNGLKVTFGNSWWKHKSEKKELHKTDGYKDFFNEINQSGIYTFLNTLPWRYMRYPRGTDTNYYENESSDVNELPKKN